MPEPSSAHSLESFGKRPFSFYPAIRNIEYNEWTVGRETWAEVQVVNSRTGEELWIPRHYIGSVSSADEPVLIVGLKRELEVKGGAVWPYERPVIEMPPPPREAARKPAPPAQTPVAAAPPASAESQVGRMIFFALAVGLTACLLAVAVAFLGVPRPWEWWTKRQSATSDQLYLALTAEDGVHDVIRKLGPPERDQWITPETAELHFQLLWYPRRSYVVVLMGAERTSPRYIGTLHAASRQVLDSVKLPGGGSTASMLRSLPKF